eukprot:Hpha_TRINITY_DN3482_c0_g1::TRINITY_DN3482_c0_g1_i1::g.32677::m.32677
MQPGISEPLESLVGQLRDIYARHEPDSIARVLEVYSGREADGIAEAERRFGVTPRAGVLYTFGHSSHTTQAFFERLLQYGVGCLCDVRSVPYSGRFPQFKQKALKEACQQYDVEYIWLGEELGGKGEDAAGSNIWGKVEQEAGRRALEGIRERCVAASRRLQGGEKPSHCAIMCSEGDWRHCHRSVISNTVCLRFPDIAVDHIHPKSGFEPHPIVRHPDTSERRLKPSSSPAPPGPVPSQPGGVDDCCGGDVTQEPPQQSAAARGPKKGKKRLQ